MTELICYAQQALWVLSRDRILGQKQNMAKLDKIVCLLFFITLHYYSFADESKSITDDCKIRCEKTYPPHTYPKKETHSACLRGCRLSAIGQLSSSNRSKENTSKSCITGCIEGYSDKDSQFACKVGCNEQAIIPTPETLFKEHKMAFGLWSVSGYTRIEPIMVARQYCHGLIRRITYYVKTSTAYYSSSQNGKTLVVRVNNPPQFFASVSAVEKQSDDESQINVHLEKRGHFDHDHHHHNSYAWKAIDKSKAWLHCVSRRSGLPFWLLTAVLFMGFAFMLWLCCSSIGTSHREEKEKRLLVDDIYLLDGDELLHKKQPLFKSDEADPLPVKVNISATTI